MQETCDICDVPAEVSWQCACDSTTLDHLHRIYIKSTTLDQSTPCVNLTKNPVHYTLVPNRTVGSTDPFNVPFCNTNMPPERFKVSFAMKKAASSLLAAFFVAYETSNLLFNSSTEFAPCHTTRSHTSRHTKHLASLLGSRMQVLWAHRAGLHYCRG